MVHAKRYPVREKIGVDAFSFVDSTFHMKFHLLMIKVMKYSEYLTSVHTVLCLKIECFRYIFAKNANNAVT